jgi:hypothetical protein
MEERRGKMASLDSLRKMKINAENYRRDPGRADPAEAAQFYAENVVRLAAALLFALQGPEAGHGGYAVQRAVGDPSRADGWATVYEGTRERCLGYREALVAVTPELSRVVCGEFVVEGYGSDDEG